MTNRAPRLESQLEKELASARRLRKELESKIQAIRSYEQRLWRYADQAQEGLKYARWELRRLHRCGYLCREGCRLARALALLQTALGDSKGDKGALGLMGFLASHGLSSRTQSSTWRTRGSNLGE